MKTTTKTYPCNESSIDNDTKAWVEVNHYSWHYHKASPWFYLQVSRYQVRSILLHQDLRFPVLNDKTTGNILLTEDIRVFAPLRYIKQVVQFPIGLYRYQTRGWICDLTRTHGNITQQYIQHYNTQLNKRPHAKIAFSIKCRKCKQCETFKLHFLHCHHYHTWLSLPANYR